LEKIEPSSNNDPSLSESSLTNGGIMKKALLLAFLFLSATSFSSEAGVYKEKVDSNPSAENKDALPIVNRWSGDYPIARLDQFKDVHARLHGGYIGDEAGFASFWKEFKPGTAEPRVNFKENLVVFVRGDASYRQMFIAKVTLKQNVAEVVASGNKSRSTPEDSFVMALAVIPRAGVKFVRVGSEQIAVE
jgi:hypothetical protein